MKSRILSIEFITSVLFHIALLFVFGQSFYQESAYSMASQAIEISMEMLPEVQEAQAMVQPAPAEPKAELVSVKEKEIIKQKKIVKKIQAVQVQQVIEKPAAENKTTTESDVNSLERGRLGEVSDKIKYDTKAKPDYLKNPPPFYPWESKRDREQGVVLLTVTIGSDGKVKDLRIKKSSSFKRLDQAALKSVKKWSFKPAKFAGLPVESEAIVPIRFVLR